MDLEETVSKGQCIVTLAQQQSWSHILSLSDLSTLWNLGELRGASCCPGQRLWQDTLWVLATVFPSTQRDVEPPCVSDRLCINSPSATCSQTPNSLWLGYTTVPRKTCFNIASSVYFYL